MGNLSGGGLELVKLVQAPARLQPLTAANFVKLQPRFAAITRDLDLSNPIGIHGDASLDFNTD